MRTFKLHSPASPMREEFPPPLGFPITTSPIVALKYEGIPYMFSFEGGNNLLKILFENHYTRRQVRGNGIRSHEEEHIRSAGLGEMATKDM